MRRDHVPLGPAALIAYGHYGRPVLVFPSEQGSAGDFEANGMVGAVADLVEEGRAKLYCVDSGDGHSWSDRSIPTEERASRHEDYERWLLDAVVPFIAADCSTGDPASLGLVTVGCSLGAYQAVNFALRHAELAPLAIGFSGNYDPTSWNSWGELGDATYFNNPMSYVANLGGDHLEWLRKQVSLLLVVGQGPWEVHPTGSLPGTLDFAELLRAKGIRHELDVWGHDAAHDWPWWRRELAHHLPRFC